MYPFFQRFFSLISGDGGELSQPSNIDFLGGLYIMYKRYPFQWGLRGGIFFFINQRI
jgi:hypothetical protein